VLTSTCILSTGSGISDLRLQGRTTTGARSRYCRWVGDCGLWRPCYVQLHREAHVLIPIQTGQAQVLEKINNRTIERGTCALSWVKAVDT